MGARPSRLDALFHSTFGPAVAGAVLLWAAFPPLDLWPLAWLAPVCWVLLIRRRKLAGRRPYGAVWLAGFLFWLGAVHWIRLSHWTAYFGWALLAFYLAFYLPVFVGLARVAVHRLRVPVIVAAPVVWTGLELARGHLLTGFTMASLGHTQYRWIDLIQVSDLAGAYGVGAVVMLVAACLGRMAPCDDRLAAAWPLIPAAAVLGAVLVYGHLRVNRAEAAPRARIALIQGSIDTEVKHDPDKLDVVHEQYTRLSQDAVARSGSRGVDLVVWPETMFRYPLVSFDENPQVPEWWEKSEDEFHEALRRASEFTDAEIAVLALRLDSPLILGLDRQHYGARGLDRFNSAVYVSARGEVLGHYDKMHLVMFGEWVPLAERFPWLKQLSPMVPIDRGRRAEVFELPGGLRVAPDICYETVIPHVIRGQVNSLRARGQEPDVLVNLTNDGWFRGSSELDMHLVCGVFRAVECRKPLLIAANTGFSAFIDGDGRIRQQGPRRATGWILADVAPDGRGSWYLWYGDWPAGLCLAGCVLFGLVGGWDRIRRRLPCGRSEGCRVGRAE